MSTAKAKNGLAIEPRAAQETTPQAPALRIAPGTEQDQGPLLAQIPDLDPNARPKGAGKKGRRPCHQPGAVDQGDFWRGSRARTRGDPAVRLLARRAGPSGRSPNFPHGPSWRFHADSDGASQNVASAWPALPTAAPRLFPPSTAHPVAGHPLCATAAGYRYSTDSPHRTILVAAPVIRQSGACLTPSPAPNNYINPPVANANWPSNNFANPPSVNTTSPDNRGFDRPADPRNFQADNRNDPAAAYRNNDPRFDSRGGTIDPAPSAATFHLTDILATRYGNPNNSCRPPRHQGSPLMPSNVQAPTSANPYPPVSEPGVARFDGTIATPPVRMSYDRLDRTLIKAFTALRRARGQPLRNRRRPCRRSFAAT